MAPKDKQVKKRVVSHKPKLAHKLAKYVRAYPVHLVRGDQQPSLSHLCRIPFYPALGGPARKKVTNRSNTWYPSDDETKHYLRPRNHAKPAAASKSLTPGKVLILLAGKYRGKRVILLKRLPSGLLLVAGPHKLNGVPLKRVNAAYVLATSATVALDGVNVNEVTDEYFKKVLPRGKRTEGAFRSGAKREVRFINNSVYGGSEEGADCSC